jgi:hypothetical protein
MPESPHTLSKLFLAGAIVKDGMLSGLDNSYIVKTAEILKDLHIPMGPHLVSAINEPKNIVKFPYDYANLSKAFGGVDYLKLEPKEREILLICNIPALRKDTFNTLENFRAHREWRKAQKDIDMPDNHELSEIHSAKKWREKIDSDRPYLVACHGAEDVIHADQIQSSNYVSLLFPNLLHSILIDHYYLQNLYFPLSQIWATEKKMPKLIPVIHSLGQDPSRTVFECNSAQRFIALPKEAGLNYDF